MSLSIDLRFTDPAAPLFIDVEGDSLEALFVISTNQVHGAVTGAPSQHYQSPANKKREREETPADQNRNKKPMKAAQRVDRMQSLSRSPQMAPSLATGQPSQRDATMPPPFFVPFAAPPSQGVPPREPLFWPPSSQLSVADEAVLRETGLGIEDMDANELADMLEGEGEEVAYDFPSQLPLGQGQQGSQAHQIRLVGVDSDSFDIEIEEAELAPTQNADNSKASIVSYKSQVRWTHGQSRCFSRSLKIN
jgi:cell cycle checkpoint control protein RAD9A